MAMPYLSTLLRTVSPVLLCASLLSGQTAREAELLQLIRKLEARVAVLEAQVLPKPVAEPAIPVPQPAPEPAIPDGVTANVTFDGFYGYNFNRPVGRVNLLRAYDVTANNFAINQTGVVIERSVDPKAGRRLGLRLDFMHGQATETLQGGTQSEPRPQVYRNIFQAYGTYVVPAGNGITVDFGKFADTLGFEGNYTKDQINYSRSYWFKFLPFYHMGFRTSYQLHERVKVTNWLVNGANQTEDFNNFKSTAFLVSLKPSSKTTLDVNYYAGQEGRDLVPAFNPGLPALPTQPGLSLQKVPNPPEGHFHAFNTFGSWSATDNLLFAGEFNTALNRRQPDDPPARATGGIAWTRYRFTREFSLGGRFALLHDRGGVFSGTRQTLKDATVTATYQIRDGFQTKWEFRRDFSNVPFFLNSRPGERSRSQTTATLGLIWWFGGKEGTW